MRDLFEKYNHIACWALLLFVLLVQLWEFESRREVLYFVGASVFFLGVPHGAADTLIYVNIRSRPGLKGWVIFLSTYALLVAFILYIWIWNPSMFLGYLLIISMIHFGDDLHSVSDPWIRLIYGFAIVSLPALIWQEDVAKVYGFLVDESSAIRFAHISHSLALISVLLIGFVYFMFLTKKESDPGRFWLWPMVTLTILKPILGFSLYFSVWHSRLHIQRLLELKMMNWKLTTLTMILVPLFFTSAALLYGFHSLGEFNEVSLSKIMFVGLGSLTFPHFLMVYSLRSRVIINQGSQIHIK